MLSRKTSISKSLVMAQVELLLRAMHFLPKDQSLVDIEFKNNGDKVMLTVKSKIEREVDVRVYE